MYVGRLSMIANEPSRRLEQRKLPRRGHVVSSTPRISEFVPRVTKVIKRCATYIIVYQSATCRAQHPNQSARCRPQHRYNGSATRLGRSQHGLPISGPRAISGFAAHKHYLSIESASSNSPSATLPLTSIGARNTHQSAACRPQH